MGKFIKGSELNAQLERLFEEATLDLVIISPFIKLHLRLVDILKSKKLLSELRIIIVFGKNQDNIVKSLNREDFIFLKDFPNIEIRYEPRLHAKYYANEKVALLSSMNLYDYSQNTNIEFGILTKRSGFLSAGDDLDKHSFEYFNIAAN